MRRRQSQPVSPWAPRYPSLTEKVKNSFHVSFLIVGTVFSCRFADGKAANGSGNVCNVTIGGPAGAVAASALLYLEASHVSLHFSVIGKVT